MERWLRAKWCSSWMSGLAICTQPADEEIDDLESLKGYLWMRCVERMKTEKSVRLFQ